MTPYTMNIFSILQLNQLAIYLKMLKLNPFDVLNPQLVLDRWLSCFSKKKIEKK